MSIGSCQNTLNQNNCQEEVEVGFFNTSLSLVRSGCCFYSWIAFDLQHY